MMKRPQAILWLILVMVLASNVALLAAAGDDKPAWPGGTHSQAAPATTIPANIPDVVSLDQLQKAGQNLYAAVPFEHRQHAQMAQMWSGCTTCHHHTPQPEKEATAPAADHGPTQADAGRIPACRNCHAVSPEKGTIAMPSLKGAYHRQCLNCHCNWMDANACVICHAAQGPGTTATMPSPDDIVGRMHKPIAVPATRAFVARVTPADGANVLFRHEEHVQKFGLKCASCHRDDSCGRCHADTAKKPGQTTAPAILEDLSAAPPLPPSPPAGPTFERTTDRVVRAGSWQNVHSRCVNCHKGARCAHCHYETGKPGPAEFDHATTRQPLDSDHGKLACEQCHAWSKPATLTCGDSSCHKRALTPTDRPGPQVEVSANTATTKSASAPSGPPATTSSTQPTVIRIRRGGS